MGFLMVAASVARFMPAGSGHGFSTTSACSIGLAPACGYACPCAGWAILHQQVKAYRDSMLGLDFSGIGFAGFFARLPACTLQRWLFG